MVKTLEVKVQASTVKTTAINIIAKKAMKKWQRSVRWLINKALKEDSSLSEKIKILLRGVTEVIKVTVICINA